jgi:hypothetical protein
VPNYQHIHLAPAIMTETGPRCEQIKSVSRFG